MSRLDRLILLLDTGTTVVRNTAAEHLAQVQKAHPHELFNLLGRVVPYLKSQQWDTRVAAAKAIGGIVEHVPVFDPNSGDQAELNTTLTTSTMDFAINDSALMEDKSLVSPRTIKNEQAEASDQHASSCVSQGLFLAEHDKLNFERFSITNVIKNGKPLLGSAGKEYDWQGSDISAEDRLARAKHDVTNRLGLGAEFMDKDFLSLHDLSGPGNAQKPSFPSPSQPVSNAKGQNAILTLSEPCQGDTTPLGSDGLSARQRNKMKRKAKLDARPSSNKVRVVDVSSSATDRQVTSIDSRNSLSTPKPDNPPDDYFSITPQAHNQSKVVVEHKIAPKSPSAVLETSSPTGGWPLDGLVELLILDLFDLRWEIRHGAALALREILRLQGHAAGRRQGRDRQTNVKANKIYLDDLACRLCCVFALDRFGDYVSDQVVAPVRETVAQTLAALLKHLSEDSVRSTFQVLKDLVFQPGSQVKAWEVIHGGMLGMKYLVAVRKDVLTDSPKLFDEVIAAVLHALENNDDDVRAVGAATLVPITSEFVQSRPKMISDLLNVLWACLAELRDDLSASTGSVMDLLAKLCSDSVVLDVMQERSKVDTSHSFSELIPRLYPFLRHTITSVRRAVLRTLRTFVKIDSASSQSWIDARLLRLLLQNLLLEQNSEVLKTSLELWTECIRTTNNKGVHVYELFSPFMSDSLTLLLTPIGEGRHAIPLDTRYMIKSSGSAYLIPQNGIKSHGTATDRKKKIDKDEQSQEHNLDSPMIRGDLELVGLDVLLRTRGAAATAMGRMLATWPVEVARRIISERLHLITQPSASTSAYMLAILLEECALYVHDSSSELFLDIRPFLEGCLTQAPADQYTNQQHLLNVVRGQSQALCNAFIEHGRVTQSSLPVLGTFLSATPTPKEVQFGLKVAEKLIGEDYERLQRVIGAKYRGPIITILEDLRQAVHLAIETLKSVRASEDLRIRAASAAALVAMGQIPKKLNPIIKSLMDSIKAEENHFLQRRSAEALARLVELCVSLGRGSAADKLIKNLCAYLCVDVHETPEFYRHVKQTLGIYSLNADKAQDPSGELDDGIQSAKVKHRGAQTALEEMVINFSGHLFEKIPKLAECIFSPMQQAFSADKSPVDLREKGCTLGQEVIDGISVLGSLVGKFDPALMDRVVEAIPYLLQALQCEFATIRHVSARTIANICKADPVRGMQIAITSVIPMLADAGQLEKRQGAIEAIHFLVTFLDIEVLPYVIFLVVPVLGRMSDSDNDVRIFATTIFAMLVKLVPLEAGIPDPPGLPPELLEGRDLERKFIQQMLDGSKVETFEIPVAIKADLRSYQQEGVNWLAFLNKYQLHGILCDDMGLGKTLQTICIVASDHHNRRVKYKDTALQEFRPLPSLIICPPSLSGHWQYELTVYAPFLRIVSYVNAPTERKLQRAALAEADVVITSYDIVRNDIEFLSKKNFNYCVLDEGHIIKNSKAKLTQSVKMIKANHRLILSGTPIQNNVLELWSLFDFLMPGFLGTEKTFHERYAKPIANSRDSKSSSKEQEAGALALEALHKQVLPFLLRRLKEEVLADLPPKIIQDYYCELSPLQKSLYNDFTTSQASSVIQDATGRGNKEGKSHVFQALQYMRKLCNHPALVLNSKHPKYKTTTKDLSARGLTLRDVQHAPKLLALRDLLVDCGIGSVSETNSADSATAGIGSSVVNQHRALIFCQIKDMLDMVENDVLKKLLPGVSYMRMDGTTDPRHRQTIVQEFNADPSIDVLLLTTHVGGLGLNLTGADTVIFVEHDWNPMKDLQAMDRAHRIGQKKTVNVYRLITRGTLEEKIMGLQKFKINIASTIVNQQNSGLATMETDQILDLFNIEDSGDKQKVDQNGGVDSQGNIIKKGQKSLFDDLDALHNEEEYMDFDVDAFVQTL